MTHPSEVGSTSQLTLLAAVAGHTLSNPCKKKGASIIVAAGMCIGLDGVGHVFPPYFIPPETKINAARYQDMLRSYYDPWAKTFCGADAAFQQDGAPSHTARTTRALLGEMSRETLVWPARLRFVGFMGVSRRSGEPNGRHNAARSHHQDPREDHQ